MTRLYTRTQKESVHDKKSNKIEIPLKKYTQAKEDIW